MDARVVYTWDENTHLKGYNRFDAFNTEVDLSSLSLSLSLKECE